jgi:hypothetical protein
MFKNNFNIIIAPAKTWKSSALHAFAYDLKSQLNKKIIFLGATHEFEGSTHFMNQRYELYRFMSYDDENNMKTLQVIEELCKKEKIDFLFVDDIESFFPVSKAAAKKYVEFIDKIPVRKVATCNDESSIPLYDYEITDSKNYFLEMRYNKGRSYAMINDVIANDFIKAFIRDEKIKTILE